MVVLHRTLFLAVFLAAIATAMAAPTRLSLRAAQDSNDGGCGKILWYKESRYKRVLT